MSRTQDTTFSYSYKTSSSFFGLKKSSFKESSFIEQAKHSLIQSDSNLTLDATSSLLLEGVKISSNNTTLKANTLEIKPLILQSYQEVVYGFNNVFIKEYLGEQNQKWFWNRL